MVAGRRCQGVAVRNLTALGFGRLLKADGKSPFSANAGRGTAISMDAIRKEMTPGRDAGRRVHPDSGAAEARFFELSVGIIFILLELIVCTADLKLGPHILLSLHFDQAEFARCAGNLWVFRAQKGLATANAGTAQQRNL